jgi:hypothetical protein
MQGLITLACMDEVHALVMGVNAILYTNVLVFADISQDTPSAKLKGCHYFSLTFFYHQTFFLAL